MNRMLAAAARIGLRLMPDPVPKRQRTLARQQAVVDGITFTMPINSEETPALMAAFPCNADAVARLLPGEEMHPVRLPGGKGVVMVTVVNYVITDIGKYVEYSLAVACTHGRKPAPPLLPALLMGHYGTGQFVVDLPVSSEISVKGGKGIWGMPKHQANLNYIVGPDTVSSQYDLDGQLALKIEIARPRSAWLPLDTSAANYCAFRGLMVKSYIHFKGKAGIRFLDKNAATLTIGTHPRVQPLRDLEISPHPLATCFVPEANGRLDDYFESWFLSYAQRPASAPEGLATVVNLGQGQEWLAPPAAHPAPSPERQREIVTVP